MPSPSISARNGTAGVPLKEIVEVSDPDDDDKSPDENSGSKERVEYAVPPDTSTLIGPYDADCGTVTVRDVDVAFVTVAVSGPKRTMSFAAVELKPVPEIVTLLPIAPASGVNELMVCADRIGTQPVKRNNIFNKYFISLSLLSSLSQRDSPS